MPSRTSHPALIPRELSQLAFNARVLQEARDETVPLLERLRFLGIFSSNQDEYYRVRVAAVQRLQRLGKVRHGYAPEALLTEIQRRILRDQAIFLRTYSEVLRALDRHGIRIVTNDSINGEQREFIRETFVRKVRPHLTPVMLRRRTEPLPLDERDIYLAVRVIRARHRRPIYAIVDIPTRAVPRFVRLPGPSDERTIILLEDIIRDRLPEIFSIFRVESTEGYVVKLTRDSGIDLNRHPKDSFLRQVKKGVLGRRTAAVVRFVYDEHMPDDLLGVLRQGLDIRDPRVLVPGGRHHNFKDFISFPNLNRKLRYRAWPSLGIPAIDRSRSVMRAMRRQDILIHTPYQRFSYLIDLLREAAIDPRVRRISLTLYRVANPSGVVGALVNAARNGKDVTAVVELTARFDEASNIEFTDVLSREGVRVVFGPEALKVHAKLGLIERREKGGKALYGFLGTGNLNEVTANIYTDHFLLTTHEGICRDVRNLFRLLRRPWASREMAHLAVAPWTLQDTVANLIRAETGRARRGEPASIEAKLNNLTDRAIVGLLGEAVEAGVRVRLAVRGTFSMPTDDLPDDADFRAISIVDRFLEHARFVIFGNGGDPLYFCSSGDWMPRGFRRRVEVLFPIYDPRIQAQLRQYLDLQWADNRKAREHDSFGLNERAPGTGAPVRSQESIYRWLREATEREGGEAEPRAHAAPAPASEHAARERNAAKELAIAWQPQSPAD